MKFKTELVDEIFAEYTPIFNLEMPYAWDVLKDVNDCLGYHVIEDFGTETDFHYISLNFSLMTDEEILRETIAHELAHAWQYENGFPTEHDADFAAWCAYFEIEHNLNIASQDVDPFEIFSAKCDIMKRRIAA